MSMDKCKICYQLVDTDADPECYYLNLPNGKQRELDYCLCVDCKEQQETILENQSKGVV